MSVIKKETIDVRRIGTALIGGDFTGDARGIRTVDLQPDRANASEVASASHSITIGYRNTASGIYGIAIGYLNIAGASRTLTLGYRNEASGQGSTASGYQNTTSAYYCSAFGYLNDVTAHAGSAIGAQNTVDGAGSSAIGYQNTATAIKSNAFGYEAESRIERTTNICGPQINRKDDGEAAADAFESFCGVEVILMSKEVDMKVVTDHTITLPANCKFWLNEIGIIARTVTDLVTQPTVRYGITGDLDKHNAAAITTALTAADKREIETPLVPEDGETSLTGGITIAADATAFTGRFYWKGMFVEDE